MNNLLSNALKFTKSLVFISVVKSSKNRVKLVIKDDGEGFEDKEIISRLNNNEIITSTPGRHGELGTGVGLMIIKDLVEQNAAELNFINSPNGLTVELIFGLCKQKK